MANQDILDAIDAVKNQFGGLHGGKMAGKGQMTCQGYVVGFLVDSRA